MENGKMKEAIGNSELAVLSKATREESNIGWNAIADASGSLGSILVLENEKNHGENRRIGGGGRAPAIPEVLWEAGKNEVNASEDESERVEKADGGHDGEEFGADQTPYGHH